MAAARSDPSPAALLERIERLERGGSPPGPTVAATPTPAPEHATYVVERMKERGVLLSTDGPDHNVIKNKPPLVFSADDADRLTKTLADVLAENPASLR